MGPLRGGANKSTAKRQPFSDFKKKTAKVGRKVQSSNVTKIEVTSKRIQIPLQSQITASKPENEQENLNLLLKTLQHYSGPARTTALEDLKELLSASPSTESYISLMFPPALELLFDDERDTRKALITLLTSLLAQYPSYSFISIVPVTMTYICSGLTSLNKGVRRDALSLLLAIATMHSHILIPHLEKLVAHVLALLVDPGQAGGQDSLGSTSTSAFASSGGAVSKAKLDDSWKKKGKASETAKPAANARPPLLVAVLEVIDAMLTSVSLASQPAGVRTDDTSANCVLYLEADNAHFKQAIMLRPIRRSSLSHKAGKVAARSSGHDDAESLLSAGLVVALCRRLKSIWSGLVLDSSVIAAHTVDVFILVAKISYRLGEAFHCIKESEFKSLVGSMFSMFPHSSLEASLAAPGSARERSSNLKISTLDLCLCDVALLFYQTMGADAVNEVDASMSGTHSKVNAYLMQKLQSYVEETTLQLARNVPQIADTAEDSMDFEETEEEKGEKDAEGEQELQTFTTSYSNISVRLFHALEIVTLAAGRRELNGSDSHSNSNSRGSGSEWSMSALLVMLKQLMDAFVSASSTGGASRFSRRSLLAAVEPTLKCMFRVASDTSLWSGGYPEETLSPLANALTVVSTLIQSADSTASSSSSVISPFRTELAQLGEAYAYALLSIVRRAPPQLSDVPCNPAMDLLCRSVKGLFETPKVAPTSSSSSSVSSSVKAVKLSSFYHYSSTATRFLLLDVFAYTPFGDPLAAMKSVTSAISSSSTSVEEQKYFLRIAFERRAEMGAGEFIEQLFHFLRLNITSRCHGLEGVMSLGDVTLNAVAVKKARDLTGRWVAHDISDVVVWCSSADAPEKILAFVKDLLSTLAAPALECLEGKGEGEKEGKGMVVKRGIRGWVGQYASSVATIAMCLRLLSPLLGGEGGVDTESEAVSGVVSMLSKACVGALSLCGVSEERGVEKGRVGPKGQGQVKKASVTVDQLTGPVIDALCVRSASSVASSADSQTEDIPSSEAEVESAAQSYFVLRSFLAVVKECWGGLSVQQRKNVQDAVTSISTLTSSEEAVTMRLVCSRDLESTLAFMASHI